MGGYSSQQRADPSRSTGPAPVTRAPPFIVQPRHPRHDRLRSVLLQRRRFGDSRRRARSHSPTAADAAAEMPTVPTLHIDTGTLAALAASSCVAVSGCNTVLATVTLQGPSSSPPLHLRPDRVVLRALPRRRPHPLHSPPSRQPAARRERDAGAGELFPNNSVRPPTTATPHSLSPRTPPSRPCTLTDEKLEVLLASGAGCVRVALFKDERRGMRRGDDDS